MPTTSLPTSSISKSDTPKTAPRTSRKPYTIMRSEMGPAMSIKIATEMNLAFLHKEIRSSMLRLLQKTK